MSALDQLKEKVEAWKTQIKTLQEENQTLKKEIEAAAGGSQELEKLRATVIEYEETITALRDEIAEKDQEIEEIIAKVEALLA